MIDPLSAASLDLPPLLYGEATNEAGFTHAIQRAKSGCDAGLVAYAISEARISAAIVLAPEVPLRDAMVMRPLCEVALQNALGSLAPPELAIHFGWASDIWLNGAHGGAFRIAASTTIPDECPDWLVVGFDLTRAINADEPGFTPDQTALTEEGCADLDPLDLLSLWSRHVCNWIAKWEADGGKAIADHWLPLANGLNHPVTHGGESGIWLGIDDEFGMILKSDAQTRILPLTTCLETLE